MMLSKNDAVLWASQVPPPRSDNFLHSGWDSKLFLALQALSANKKRKLIKTPELAVACTWLIEALYQANRSLPSCALAIPKSTNAYSPDAAYRMPFGYRITMELIAAAIHAGFVKEELGYWNSGGTGRVTRYKPVHRLLAYFNEIGHVWQQLQPPTADSLIIAKTPSNGWRRKVSDNETRGISLMRNNTDKINRFLSKQCIWIDLPNSILSKGFRASQSKLQDAVSLETPELNKTAINFQRVFLRRIFGEDFDQGGRFYGGWWQNIKSEYRSRILINDHLTCECDFSSLSIRMLYAIEGIDPGTGDQYDLGINYVNDPAESRNIVKRFANATLNDREGKYRLSWQELEFLGVTHRQLLKALHKRHPAICKHFYSGVGVFLQSIDAKIAEKVMLHFLQNEEVCLPVHDSFIVRRGLERELILAMKQAFFECLKGVAKIDAESGYKGFSIGEMISATAAVDAGDAIATRLENFSIALGYFHSWERQAYSEEEICLRDRHFDELLNADR